MSVVRRNGHWLVALAGVACVAWAAGVMTDRGSVAHALTNSENGQHRQGVADARDLSAAFRKVSKEALPGIVSIETIGHAAKISDNDADAFQFGEGTPFGNLFKNDPRFKDMLKNRRPQGQAPRSHGMGSGIIIDESGIVLTNNHVVRDAEQVKVKLSDGRVFEATDIKTDPRSDVAIVRIHADGKLPALRLGNSDAVEIGDWVLAVGSPFGLDLSVTAGIISAKGRGPGITEREDFLQTDAAINPGNSGGPLLNLDGEVIGMNTAISSRSGGYEGIGFAVPMNMARWIVDQLMSSGTVSRAYLGVVLQPVDAGLANQFKVPVGHGAIVTQVVPDSPAAVAKLEAGDLIAKFNGKEVHSPRTLQGAVEQLKVGEKADVVVLRDGKEVKLTVVMKELPKDIARQQESEVENSSSSSSAEKFEGLGIEISQLTPEVARQLGYKDVHGVVITSVKEDSPAAATGLREGMVIEKVGSKKVSTPEEFKTAVKDMSVDNGILMLVRNQRGTQFVVVKGDKTAKTSQK